MGEVKMGDISPAQVKLVKTLVTKLLLKDVDALVLGFSDGRTAHVSKLRMVEATALIKHLKGLDPEEKSAERMRGKLIGIAYERAGLGRSAGAEQKKDVVQRLDNWCKQYGYKHKGLNNYTYAELPKLVSQFEAVQASDFRALNKMPV